MPQRGTFRSKWLSPERIRSPSVNSITSPSLFSPSSNVKSQTPLNSPDVNAKEMRSPLSPSAANNLHYVNIACSNQHTQLLVTDGTTVPQLRSVLQSVFDLTDKVVGLFEPIRETIFPLSLVVTCPSGFAAKDAVYQLVTESGVMEASQRALLSAIKSDRNERPSTSANRPVIKKYESQRPRTSQSPIGSITELYSPVYFKDYRKQKKEAWTSPQSTTNEEKELNNTLSSPKQRKKWTDSNEFLSSPIRVYSKKEILSPVLATSGNLYVANVLTITEAEELDRLQHRCGLAQLSLSLVVSLFKRHVKYGRLSRKNFQSAAETLIEAIDEIDDSSIEERSYEVMQILQRVYDIYSETPDASSVSWSSFLVGISMICPGSTEEKLRIVFSAFDSNADDYVSVNELAAFFEAFYAVALDLSVTLQQYFSSIGVEDLYEIARQSSQECFEAVGSTDGRISYGEFKEWFLYVNSVGPEEEDDEFPEDEKEDNYVRTRKESDSSELVSPLIRGIGVKYQQSKRSSALGNKIDKESPAESSPDASDVELEFLSPSFYKNYASRAKWTEGIYGTKLKSPSVSSPPFVMSEESLGLRPKSRRQREDY